MKNQAAKTEKINFHTWLMKQCDRDDMVGDLARDASRDESFPKKGTLKSYLEYLGGMYACSGAFDAMKLAWKERGLYSSSHFPERSKKKVKKCQPYSDL